MLLPYRHGKDNDGAFEDLHVHISADTYEKVDAAVAIVEPLLIPVDEDRNIYKMKQLRELAEMNGTVRDFIRICTLCGEEGHREWQCPKDKLQTFQAKVICRLCGDGSHPTMDCPLKFSGQGRAIDKEYLSFLEELGAGLGGIDPPAKPDFEDWVHKPGADTSQPMLLTSSGAQPMPARWMAYATGSKSDSDLNPRTASDGGSEESGGFPRFPFPFPFPPPGPHGMNPMNFLPPFFHPALLGLFRGGGSFPGQSRPFPGPSLQMMAFMLSAFRGRFPFPPFGFRPNMMRPPMRPPPASLSSWMPVEIPMSGQSMTSEMVAEAVQNQSEACLPSIGILDSYDKQNTNVGVPVSSSAEAPSFLSSSIPFSSSVTAPPVSKTTLLFESNAVSPSATISSAVNPEPVFSSVSTLNVRMPSSGYTISPVLTQPLLPSFRPVPSVRPVVPPVVQSPSFTLVRGPGLAPLVAPPSWVGTGNVTSSSGLDNFCKPAVLWNSSASWSQNQSSMESCSTSQPDKPASKYDSSQFFPTPNTLNQVPPRIDDDAPPLFSTGENPALPSTSAAGSGSSSFPTLHPPSVPAHFESFTPRLAPFVIPAMPSSFTPGVSQISRGQFGAPVSNHSHELSFSHPDSWLGPPPSLGPPYSSGGSGNSIPPVGDYQSFSSLRQHSVFLPDAPTASRMQIAHDYHRTSTFLSSEFSYARPQEPSYVDSGGSHLNAEFQQADSYHSGRLGQSVTSFDNQELRRGGTTPLPSETFGSHERTSYRYEPSIPMTFLQQNVGSVLEPWNANLHNRTKPGVQQPWGQPQSGGDGQWNQNP